jgi:hypothetical protein
MVGYENQIPKGWSQMEAKPNERDGKGAPAPTHVI